MKRFVNSIEILADLRGGYRPGWAQYAYTAAHPHAVVSVERGAATDTFTYDENGNMTQRVEGGVTWTQTFNSENRLVSVSNETQSWNFTYDGDGNRVKQVGPEGTTIFLGGGLYTKVIPASGSPEVTKYYAVGGQRVAMSKDGVFNYLITDHLGSVDSGISQTDFGFTGQRDLAAVGLMDY